MPEPKTLNQVLLEEFGKQTIHKTEVPQHIVENLNPNLALRPYQEDAFKFFLKYWDGPFEGKPTANHHLLFHMATGSGKTFMMAGLMLHLYQQGYRNFMFFVNSTNIIQKTCENFLNPLSHKYLFAEHLALEDKKFAVREVDNFQAGNMDDLNVVFTTIQGLHMTLNNPKENSLTYDDFENQRVVLISDEAHHLNVDTKKGYQLSALETDEYVSWENSVKRIFKAHEENVMMEFTATVDFTDANLAEKYKPILIYDYPLKEFRNDGYSKEVKVLQVDLEKPFERSLQAVLLSQYRRKVFEKNKLAIKPVILFKSKTIAESQAFFEEFKTGINNLTAAKIIAIRDTVQEPVIKRMFQYFTENDITPENLAAELKDDFAAGKLIEVNSKEDSKKKQIAVNSLERNEYRAVFAVDKLNEGWDVLNLFDIVRLYDTRDAKKNKTGKTTMSEAQLIGRGARYCPFRLSDDQPLDQRKFDKDLGNEMRIGEELYYHSAHNPKYIQELYAALKETGIIAKEPKQRAIKLKDDFRSTNLFKSGLIFLNERKKYDCEDVTDLPNTMRERLYRVQLPTGFAKTETAFEEEIPTPAIDHKAKNFDLVGFGIPVLHKAMRQYDFFEFSNLKKHLPHLKSVNEFLTSENYLGGIKVEVKAWPEQLDNMTSDGKFFIAKKVFAELAVSISGNKVEYKGTKEFLPNFVNKVFYDKVLNFTENDGGDAQFGQSMCDPQNAYHLNLADAQRGWYAFNDCFGTSEEKSLIKYVDKHLDAFRKKYADVYLLRNERHFKIYNFDDGKPLEPDFVLFLVGKDAPDTMYYQVFVEPKGQHLLLNDAWKEGFLKNLHKEGKIEQLWKGKKYVLWGLPFYNETHRMKEFQVGVDELVRHDSAPKDTQ
jgi:type III restriction enzyme